MLIDIVLYKSWGVRIDSTLLSYINNPKIMLASVSTSNLLEGYLIWIIISFIVIIFLIKF